MSNFVEIISFIMISIFVGVIMCQFICTATALILGEIKTKKELIMSLIPFSWVKKFIILLKERLKSLK